MQNQRRDFLPPSPPRRPHSLPSPGRGQGAHIWASQIGTHLLGASSGGGGVAAGAGRPLGSTRHSHLLSFQARMPGSGRCCCSSVPPPPCHPSPAACPRNTRSGHRRGEAGARWCLLGDAYAVGGEGVGRFFQQLGSGPQSLASPHPSGVWSAPDPRLQDADHCSRRWPARSSPGPAWSLLCSSLCRDFPRKTSVAVSRPG